MDKWYACLEEINACHSLPPPSEDEKLPVGTGSNPVSIDSYFIFILNERLKVKTINKLLCHVSLAVLKVHKKSTENLHSIVLVLNAYSTCY